jgi:hypothetical protein
VFVPYISAADTVAYMRMSRRAFLATGGLATASLTSGLFHRDELATADAIASDILSGDPRRVTALATDHPMRHRYLTAVVSRVLRTPWNKARQHTADLRPSHHATAASVDLLGAELHNEHDAGARWCTAYGRALSRKALVS